LTESLRSILVSRPSKAFATDDPERIVFTARPLQDSSFSCTTVSFPTFLYVHESKGKDVMASVDDVRTKMKVASSWSHSRSHSIFFAFPRRVATCWAWEKEASRWHVYISISMTQFSQRRGMCSDILSASFSWNGMTSSFG